MDRQTNHTALEMARVYVTRYGWRPIPVPHGAKRPRLKGWQTLTLDDDDLPRHFNGRPQNIGILLGAPSGGLLDVDLDCAEAIRLAPFLLPETLTFGHRSKPRSHWLYLAEHGGRLPSTTKYQVHRGNDEGGHTAETLVELRSTGAQTIFPPSVHPSGEPIAFDDRRSPHMVGGPDLEAAVARLAAACLFLRHWPREAGARQDHAQALAGALVRSGLAADEVEAFIRAVATGAGDEEADARARTAAYAAVQQARGGRLWGWPKVAELFGEEVARQARAWLGGGESATLPGTDPLEPGRNGCALCATDGAEAPALPQRAYELLPATLREAAGFFDAWYKRDVFLTALLGALSSALPDVRFLYGQQYQSTHLYFFILARAASGKGVMTHAFRWLDAVDAHLRKGWEAEREAWQYLRNAYERAKRSGRDGAAEVEAPGPEPPERCLKAGANTTAAALGARLAANPEGIFIGSTEADTLTSANHREHGNFSHLIRQAFHNEEAQVDRKSDETLRIPHPRLALVLSGTPRQFPRFMEGGVEDGLFSRFAVYSFEAPAGFAAQWATDRDHRLDAFTAAAADRVLALYRMLSTRGRPLYFDVPDALRERVTGGFRALHDALERRKAFDLIPIVRRGVVITLRIAAVLTVWRQFEAGAPLGKAQNVMAGEADVEAAVALGLVYAEHALREALRMEPVLGALPDTGSVGGAGRMTGPQRRFFDALPDAFRTRDAEAAGQALDVPRSTLFEWLGRWVTAGLLEKLGQGRYRKQAAAGGAESRTGLLDFLDFPSASAASAGSGLDVRLDASDDGEENDNARSSGYGGVQAKVQRINGLDKREKGESPEVQRSPPVSPVRGGQRVETPRGPGVVVDVPGERQKIRVDLDALGGTPMPVRAFDAADLRAVEDAPF